MSHEAEYFVEPNKSFLEILAEMAAINFSNIKIGITEEGEIYPYNLKHASYQALLRVRQTFGLDLEIIFSILKRQSNTQTFKPFSIPNPDQISIETIRSIDIISYEAIRLHPELEKENQDRINGEIFSAHD